MIDYELFDRAPNQRGRTIVSLGADAIQVKKAGQQIELIPYGGIRRISLSYWKKWHLGTYIRCRLSLVGGGRYDVFSGATDESRDKDFQSFFAGLMARARAANPDLSLVEGVPIGRWVAMLTIHLVIAGFWLRALTESPRYVYAATPIATFAVVLWGISLLLLMKNFPRNDTRGGMQSAYAYASAQGHRRLARFLDIVKFVLFPRELADTLQSWNSAAFARAARTLFYTLTWCVGIEQLLFWSYGLSNHLSSWEVVGIKTLFALLPSISALVTFIALRFSFGNHDISVLDFLQCALYPMILVTFAEGATYAMCNWIILANLDLGPGWTMKLPELIRESCRQSMTASCVLDNWRSLANDVDAVMVKCIWATMAGVAAILVVQVRFVVLLKHAMKVSYFESALATFVPFMAGGYGIYHIARAVNASVKASL
ncbi:hypothetical protein RPPS3_13460 [Rhodopseudomonas palustris]|uniref:hypothetical protein n=1 Tax=Rhodopseudomonas palustris TaxID=1076 RepID=UPI000D1B3940|nr:hypothetical protein [Rhodopseudomonas palustris]AVT75409.1 hypothetical protein RPPS3_13460 [Rhodopseudomonas palustris]